ncbi:MAG: biotin transporter BioY [Veillonellaceae bacterium]|nr:biotin transporter BioY [Veillonellaceae bacterium]MDD6924247.1 biotin transporter BioY [Veillonellaceae bacterium]
MRSDIEIQNMARMAVCVALCCIAAYISIPVPFASSMITALTLVMNLTALLLTPKQTFAVIAVYLLLGIAGLPVLAGGSGGLGKLFEPAGGFYLSFLVAYPLVSMCKGKNHTVWRFFIATLVSIPVTYIGGVASTMMVTHMGLAAAIMVSALPYIPGDIIKGAIAAILAAKLGKLFRC